MNPDECLNCGGAGSMKVPHTYMTCLCCRDREKFRPCKTCHGKGYAYERDNEKEM